MIIIFIGTILGSSAPTIRLGLFTEAKWPQVKTRERGTDEDDPSSGSSWEPERVGKGQSSDVNLQSKGIHFFALRFTKLRCAFSFFVCCRRVFTRLLIEQTQCCGVGGHAIKNGWSFLSSTQLLYAMLIFWWPKQILINHRSSSSSRPEVSI